MVAGGWHWLIASFLSSIFGKRELEDGAIRQRHPLAKMALLVRSLTR
jgi:hypothetical protein